MPTLGFGRIRSRTFRCAQMVAVTCGGEVRADGELILELRGHPVAGGGDRETLVLGQVGAQHGALERRSEEVHGAEQQYRTENHVLQDEAEEGLSFPTHVSATVAGRSPAC